MSLKNGVIGGAPASWSAETPSFLRALALRAALVKRILYSLGFLGKRRTRGAGPSLLGMILTSIRSDPAISPLDHRNDYNHTTTNHDHSGQNRHT